MKDKESEFRIQNSEESRYKVQGTRCRGKAEQNQYSTLYLIPCTLYHNYLLLSPDSLLVHLQSAI